VRKTFSTCAFRSLLSLAAVAQLVTRAQAQHIPPYHGPAAEGQYSHDSHRSLGEHLGQGQTYGSPGGRYHGGPTQYGPAAPSYWTYNRLSNNGFGGLNWYYGPLGGYTPYITTPYGSTTYGYPYFGPYYSYVPLAPVIRQTRPYWIGGDPLIKNNGNANNNNGRPADAGDNLGAGQPAQQPVQSNVKIFGKVPTTDALRRSIRYQAQGDEWFGKQNYLQAFGHYKDAISAAPGRPEPRFRKAMALAATTNYSLAVDEMKRSMRLDPTWPQTGPKLDELFGADNLISKNAVLHKVAAWVREDIRDPDRLFLMGVLLHFNDDLDKSHTFFEAAYALAPVPEYARAFLDAEDRHGAPGQHAAGPAAGPAEEPRPAPPDEDDAPAADPPPPGPAPGPAPARRDNGPRFPAAAGLDDPQQRAKPPVSAVNPRQAAPARIFRGAAPGNAPAGAPRSAPGKAVEEPRPRPLAGSVMRDAACQFAFFNLQFTIFNAFSLNVSSMA